MHSQLLLWFTLAASAMAMSQFAEAVAAVAATAATPERHGKTIMLWEDTDFEGQNVTYGKLQACDTFMRNTHKPLGHHQSARVLVPGHCCLLYTEPACNGDEMMIGAAMSDLSAYGFGDCVRSVYCMSRKYCDLYYKHEMWRKNHGGDEDEEVEEEVEEGEH